MAADAEEEHAMNDDPDCTTCGHVSSDHPRDGRCGASVDDEDGNATCCDCVRLTTDSPSNPTEKP